MLRSDELVALDEVTEICQRNSDHLERFAELTEDKELARKFSDLSRQHREHVTRLDELFHNMDELSSRPDLDREALEQLATWVRSLFAASKRQTLVDKAREVEEELQQAILHALQQTRLPDDARPLLQIIQKDAERALADWRP